MMNLTKVKLSNFDKNLEKTVNHYYNFFKFYEKKLKEKWLKNKIKNY